MNKVYVIGQIPEGFDVRDRLMIAEDTEIIFVNSLDEVPIEERIKSVSPNIYHITSAHLYRPKLIDRHFDENREFHGKNKSKRKYPRPK